MRKTKRLLSGILSAVLCFSMFGATALAAPDSNPAAAGTVTIRIADGAEMSMTGKTFELYRVFDAMKGQTAEEVSYDWNHDVDEAHFDAASYSEDFAPGKLSADNGKANGPYYAFFFDPEENGGEARVTSTGYQLSAAMQYIRANMTDAQKTAALGEALNAYIAKHAIAPDETTPIRQTATMTAFDVPFGYYLIRETTTGNDVVSAIMLDTAAADADITLKSIQPTIDKTVYSVNGEDVAGEDGAEAASAQIGDEIVYKMALKVPDILNSLNSRGFYWYHVKDLGGTGLTMEPESGYELKLVKADGSAEKDLVINEDYLVLPASYEEGLSVINYGKNLDGTDADPSWRQICAQLVCYIFRDGASVMNMTDEEQIAVASAIMLDADIDMEHNYESFTAGGGGLIFRLTTSDVFAAGDIIEIYADAVVNSDATREVIDNKAILRYSRNISLESPDPRNISETEDHAKVYTHRVELAKVAIAADGSVTSKKLSGAVFEVYKNDRTTKLSFITKAGAAANEYTVVKPGTEEAENAVTAVKVAEDGTLSLTGLGDETYWLREVEAPAGYTIMENMLPFTVSSEYSQTTGDMTRFTAVADTADTTGAKIWIDAANVGNNTVSARVSNQIGGKLPSTGGNGVLVFTLVGIIGCGFTAFLISSEMKKRKAAK